MPNQKKQTKVWEKQQKKKKGKGGKKPKKPVKQVVKKPTQNNIPAITAGGDKAGDESPQSTPSHVSHYILCVLQSIGGYRCRCFC